MSAEASLYSSVNNNAGASVNDSSAQQQQNPQGNIVFNPCVAYRNEIVIEEDETSS